MCGNHIDYWILNLRRITSCCSAFGMTAVVVMIALGAYLGSNDDHVDDPADDPKAEDEA